MSAYYEKGSNPSSNRRKKIIGLIFIILGLIVGSYFLYPLFAYQLFLGKYVNANIEIPIPKHMAIRGGGFGSLISGGIKSITTNFSDARNWYPQINSQSTIASKKIEVQKYLLSIPKIKIDRAEVSTKDYELDRHMIQYFGTSLPGQNGNAVIFGHSTLPSLYDPKNYKTILANAHTLAIGDEMQATVGEVSYKYKIFSIVVTTPEDTNILSQSYDHSYITLVTCTPPGTIWKRLVIRAALQDVSVEEKEARNNAKLYAKQR